MIYKYFKLEFIKQEELFDLKKPIEIFTKIKELLAKDIIGSNFNKYSDGQNFFRIDIRIKFDEIKIRDITDKVNSLQKKLEDKENLKLNKELLDWTEPLFVMMAHELGTLFAINVSEWLYQPENSDILKDFLDPIKKSAILTQLLYLVLKECDFNINIIWSILRNSALYRKDELTHESRIINLAYVLSNTLKQKLTEIENNLVPDFLERTLHSFFNCVKTVNDNSEQIFINNILISSIYKFSKNKI